MAERFEIVEKALLKMLDEKKYASLRAIIIKAFDDLGLRSQRFTGIVFGTPYRLGSAICFFHRKASFRE